MSSGDKEPADASKRIISSVILTVSGDECTPLNGNKQTISNHTTPESSPYLVTRDEPRLLFLSNWPPSHGSDALHPEAQHLPLSNTFQRPTGNMSPPVSSGSIRKEFQREAPRKHPADVFEPETAKPFTNKMTTGCITAFTIALFYKYTIPSVVLGTFCVLRGVN